METSTDWYTDCVEQMERELGAGHVSFPVTAVLDGQNYHFHIWEGQLLPDVLLAFDTETERIEDQEIPDLALAVVHGSAGSCYFIHPDDLATFVSDHAHAHWCCHNAAFDFWVVARHLQSDVNALTIWWDIAGQGRMLCTMLLDSLIRLAEIDAEPISRDLATVGGHYCEISDIDKTDPYRLRYGELLGLPKSEWPNTEAGFWTYAAFDAIATLRVCQAQASIARKLIGEHEDTLLPDCYRRFGPLTVCTQVLGAIALEYVNKTGVDINVELAQNLRNDITSRIEELATDLEDLAGEAAFKRYGPKSKKAGQYQRTPAGVPKRNAKLQKVRLEQIATTCSEPIVPPRLKDGSVSDAVSFWKQHTAKHPFIDAYVGFAEQSKLAQFFGNLDTDHIYPRYRPLVRTGRTSCHSPNLQQLPRDSRFRAMIVPPEGFWLLQVDYSVLELRTLAQICLNRFGSSVLADLFRAGIDCHKYTAAKLLDLTLDEFERLPIDKQKEYRQKSKVIGFGVPGGLGAEAIVSFARQSYGVDMTMDEATGFRARLCEEIYPEIGHYLKDRPFRTIAANLQCSEADVKRIFQRFRQLRDASRIISSCEATENGDKYSDDLKDFVWETLRRVNNNPDLFAALLKQEPSSKLMRRIFYGGVATLTGRVRGHVGFTQRANTPFQGLAADGNKIALFRLLRSGIRVVGFIHDEVLALVPKDVDYDEYVRRVQDIMEASMAEVVPNVPVVTEAILADCWTKEVDEQPRDVDGKIIPYVTEER